VTRTVPAAYIRSTLGRRDPVLDRILRTSLLERRMPTIQVDDNAGRVLQLLAALRRPRQVIEIGTLFGYSAIHLARGLTGDGRLTTLESIRTRPPSPGTTSPRPVSPIGLRSSSATRSTTSPAFPRRASG